MNENIKWFAAAAAVVGLSVGAVLYISRGDKKPPVETPVVAAPKPAEPEEPGIKYPLAEAESAAPLPSLAESDPPARNALEGLIGKQSVEQFIITNDLVRHVVVTVDNLTAEKVAERIKPLKATPGRFAVAGAEDAPILDPTNFERYKPLVQMVRTLDTKQLVATYRQHYKLFQEAYESLGHPPQYFNDRVIEVIDHLLATPDLQGPITLAQPNVQFEYADPKIESRSAGQKALMRIGTENAKVVKDKLRELRAALIEQAPSN